jgi:hypothetical protein
MRAGVLVAATTLLAISCSGGSGPSAVQSLSPTASASGSPSPKPSPLISDSAFPSPSPVPLPGPNSAYGLILNGTTLQMFDVYAVLRASAPVAAPSVRTCADGMGAVLQPPVSAGKSNVFFRDGDTKIRSLTPGGRTADVTTVPGGPKTVSFFSVSPDEKRIAVLVEDLSPATTINIRLYVEDLHGGGHRVDIYKATTPKKGGSTLWPMGWRRGNLVLAVVTPCTYTDGTGKILPANLGPTEWHVSSAIDGGRLATIRRAGCALSFWPSPAGVACVEPYGRTAYLYDWGGGLTRTLDHIRVPTQTSRSQSGRTILFSNQRGIGPLPSELLKHDGSAEVSQMWDLAPRGMGGVSGLTDILCLWIDETHAIGAQSIYALPGGTRTSLPANQLIPSGVCAGRFPGGL